jgi:hypothetical protein
MDNTSLLRKYFQIWKTNMIIKNIIHEDINIKNIEDNAKEEDIYNSFDYDPYARPSHLQIDKFTNSAIQQTDYLDDYGSRGEYYESKQIKSKNIYYNSTYEFAFNY